MSVFLLFTHLFLSILWFSILYLVNQSGYWQVIFLELNISIYFISFIGILIIGLSLYPRIWQKTIDITQHSLILHLSIITVLLSLFWALYHQILQAWWVFDDPAILHYVHETGGLAGFYDPNKRLNFYVPLLGFSWWIDYQLFGFEPMGFYWHHLLAFSITIILLYFLLNHFFSNIISMMIVALFIIATPTAHIAHYMMTRHYLEGLLLSLLATLIFIHAVKKQSDKIAFLGSIPFFLATLAKEVFVPLPLALLALPISELRQRIRFIIPYFLFLFIYMAIRFYMLAGQTFSAYSESHEATTLKDIIYFPLLFMQVMGWQEIWQLLPVLAMFIIFTGIIFYRWANIGVFSFIWIACTLLPLIPIFWRIPYLYYYLFIFSLVIMVSFGIVLSHVFSWLKNSLWQKPIVLTVFLSLFLATFLPAQSQQLGIKRSMEETKIQASALLYDDSDTVLLYDSHVGNYLVKIRESILKRNAAKWCAKEDCLCSVLYADYTAKYYANGNWHKKILSPENCHVSSDKNLSVSIDFIPPATLRWKFAPYTESEGYYSVFILKQEKDKYLPYISEKIPSQGEIEWKPANTKFVIKYKDIAGWEIYSPLLELKDTETYLFWQNTPFQK